MIKVAICDDDVKITCQIENMLDANRIDLQISVFFDGSTLERSVLMGNRFDLIYLDIRMKVMNGLETARSIRNVDSDAIIIYVSKYKIFSEELFEVEPFRFISKPINEEIFQRYFNEAYIKITSRETFFQFKYNKTIIKVPVREIRYFESKGRIIYINMVRDKQKFYDKLNEVEKNLLSSKYTFLRIHQSFLVNYTYIKKICCTSAVLTDGTVLQISEERQRKIRTLY